MRRYGNDNDKTDEDLTTMTASISSPEFLTTEEARELARRAHEGDLTARNRLVECHYNLVHKLVSVYGTSKDHYDDLFQEGCIGLIEAAERFDPEKESSFLTYAYIWVRKYISRASVRTGASSRIPRRIEPYINKVLAYSRRFELTRGRTPTVEEISEETEIPPEIVCEVLAFGTPVSQYSDVSVYYHGADKCIMEDDGPEAVTSDIMRDQFHSILDDVLTAEERYVIVALFFSDDHPNMDEVALRLGTNRFRVKKIKDGAYQKIRDYFEKRKIDYRDFLG